MKSRRKKPSPNHRKALFRRWRREKKNSLIPVIMACTKVAQITESNFYFDSHTHTPLGYTETRTIKCGVNWKRARKNNHVAWMFPAAIFHSVLLNFHRNDGVFVTIHLAFCALKIAKRKPESVNATPCVFHHRSCTTHIPFGCFTFSAPCVAKQRGSTLGKANTLANYFIQNLTRASNVSSWWRHAATSHRLRQLSRCSSLFDANRFDKRENCALRLVRVMFCITFSFLGSSNIFPSHPKLRC